jgi:hypothetical protein
MARRWLDVVGFVTMLISSSAAFAEGTLFVVVTRPEPQVQAMAMILSLQALNHHTAVRVLLCGPGGDLAFSGYDGATLKPSAQTSQQMLQAVIQAGAKVELCPIYMANSGGRTEAELIPGVTVTSPAMIGDFMDQPGVRYFTF